MSTRWAAFQCASVGLVMNALSLLTANVMSGLVPFDNHSRAPIRLQYGWDVPWRGSSFLHRSLKLSSHGVVTGLESSRPYCSTRSLMYDAWFIVNVLDSRSRVMSNERNWDTSSFRVSWNLSWRIFSTHSIEELLPASRILSTCTIIAATATPPWCKMYIVGSTWATLKRWASIGLSGKDAIAWPIALTRRVMNARAKRGSDVWGRWIPQVEIDKFLHRDLHIGMPRLHPSGWLPSLDARWLLERPLGSPIGLMERTSQCSRYQLLEWILVQLNGTWAGPLPPWPPLW